MAGRRIQPHEWNELDITPEMKRQEREWQRLSSPFPHSEPPLIWITLADECGASEDIKQRVADIIHPKAFTITP